MYSLPTRTIVIHEVLHQSTTLLTVLYVVGFGLQIVGGVLIVLEVRDDLRVARRIPDPATYASLEALPDSLRERLSRNLWRRWLGVVLIFIGAGVGLTANLLALRA
jgi:hypothetical protein